MKHALNALLDALAHGDGYRAAAIMTEAAEIYSDFLDAVDNAHGRGTVSWLAANYL